jgi:hypothetical protein
VTNESLESSSNPAGPELALMTAAPDNAGIASLRGKLQMYKNYGHCAKISHEGKSGSGISI